MALTVDQLTRGLEKARAAGDSKAVREIEAELSRVQSAASTAQAPAGLSAERLSLGLERARAAGDTAAVREIEAELGRIQGAARQVPQPAPQMEPDQPVEIEANPMGANVLSILRSPMGQEFLSSATRQIPPALTSIRYGMSTTPVGFGANVAYTGLVAALSELGARFGEGKDITSPEALGKAGRAAIEYGAPGPILGGFTRMGGQNVFQMGGRAFAGVEGPASKMAQGVALTGTSILSGREAEALISGRPATPVTRENALSEVIFPSLISGGLSGMAQTLGRGADIVREIGSRRAFLNSLGVKNPTLGALFPERFAEIESGGFGPGSSGLISQRLAMGQQTSDAVSNRFYRSNYASNETVASRINPEIERIRLADENYARNSAAYEQANAAYKAAQEATNLTPAEKAIALQDAQEQVYRAVQAKANDLLTTAIGVPFEMSGKADEVSKVIGDLFTLRSNVAKDKYAPLRAIGAVFSTDDIEAAAKRGMGAYADTQEGKLLLSGIRNYRGDGVTVLPQRPNPAARMDPTEPLFLEAEVRYDLEGVRQMRESLAQVIDGVKDNAVVKRMEREASNAYLAVNESVRERLGETGGPQLVQQWDAARDYWSSSYRAMESDDFALRLLMRGKATAEEISALSKKLVSGNAGAIRAVNKFVDSVSEADPEQKRLALSQIGSAVSNAILEPHFGAGVVKWERVFDDVLKFSGFQGMQAIIPVEKLGLGTRSQIYQSRAVVRDFAKRGLTDEAIGEALASPLFRQVIEAGLPTQGPLTQELAVGLYKQRVLTAEAFFAAGMKDKANSEFAKAQQALSQAKLDKAQAAIKLAEVRSDPAYLVLTGQAKLTNVPEVTAGRIGDLLLAAKEGDGRLYLNNLAKTDPATYDAVATNTLANFLERYLKKGGEVDLTSLRQQFSRQNTEFRKLAAIFPSQTMDRLAAMPDLVRIMDDTLNARPVSDDSIRRMAQMIGFGIGTKRAIQTGTAPTAAINTQSFVKTALATVANAQYHIIASQLLNPSRSIITPGASFAESVARMPTQQAVILMNNERLAAEMARADEEAKRPRR